MDVIVKYTFNNTPTIMAHFVHFAYWHETSKESVRKTQKKASGRSFWPLVTTPKVFTCICCNSS